jgi:broad specificity phosphatase PhoE
MNPTVILVRHGETRLNAAHRIDSWLPVGLIPGADVVIRETAGVLNEHFSLANPIVCSDLPRSYETADILGEELMLEVIRDFALRSWNMGKLSGQKHADVAQFIKRAVDNPLEPLPGGESLNSFLTRWRGAFEKLIARAISSPEEAIIAVTHSRNIEACRYFATGDRSKLQNTHSVKPGEATSWQVIAGKLREVPIPEPGIGQGETADGANA